MTLANLFWESASDQLGTFLFFDRGAERSDPATIVWYAHWPISLVYFIP
jgi:hypothetical protein